MLIGILIGVTLVLTHLAAVVLGIKAGHRWDVVHIHPMPWSLPPSREVPASEVEIVPDTDDELPTTLRSRE